MKFYNLLKVSNREGSRLLYVAGSFFLLLLGIAFGRISRDAIFIQEIGAGQLPVIYILNAVLMILITGAYSRIYSRFSRSAFLIVLVAVSALVVTGLRFALSFEGDYLYYILFVVSEAIILILPLHFWTFANEVFDPREGKRVFPLIGSAGLIGTILGGVMTGLFVDYIGTANLLLVWPVVIAAVIPLMLRFRAIYGRISATGTGQSDSVSMFGNLNHLMRIPLVRTLAYMAVPMWLTVYLVDFQFFLAVEEAFDNQNDTSTALGLINGVISGAGLVFQIFLTGPILSKIGINRSVLIFPGGMVFGCIVLMLRLLLPVQAGLLSLRLLSAVFARMTDEAVLPSIGETSFQLLYNSIADEWRGRARAFISGVTEPASVALAGLFLITIGSLEVPHSLLPFIAFGFGLVWLRFALRIGGDYMDSLVSNLNSHNIDLQSHALAELSMRHDAHAARMLETSLYSEDEDVALMAVGILTRSGDTKAILNLVYSLQKIQFTGVKIHALKLIAEDKIDECWPMVVPLLYDNSSDIRAAAVRTLGLLRGEVARLTLQPFLSDQDLNVKAEVLIFLLRTRSRLDKRNVAVKELDKFIRSSKSEIRMTACRIIEQAGKKQLRPQLKRLAKAKDIAVSREAIRALGLVGDEQDVPFLVKFLDDYKRQLFASEAIQQIGPTAVVPLLTILAKQNDDGKASILDSLGKIGDGMAIAPLTAMLAGQTIEVETKALKALTQIHFVQVEADPAAGDQWMTEPVIAQISARMNELTGGLQTKLDYINIVAGLPKSDAGWLLLDALRRSFSRMEAAALLCLELLADPSAVRAAVAGIHSGQTRARAEALELIEGCGEAGAKLGNILESYYLPAKKNTKQPQVTGSELSAMLADQLTWKEKPWLYVTVLLAVGDFKLTALRTLVGSFKNKNNLLVRANALIAWQKLGGKLNQKQKKEAKEMAINMERMLFLRSVPLFSEVDGDDIHWINEITREIKFSKGDIIFRENDKGDALYIILAGTVRIIKEGKKRIILDVFAKRDCFGEMAILDQEPRSATIQAAEDTKLLVIQRDDFQRLLLARPQIGFSLFKTLSQRVRQLGARLREAEEKLDAAS